MVNKFKQKAKQLWNMINGTHKNLDGKVDIDDAWITARQKSKKRSKNVKER